MNYTINRSEIKIDSQKSQNFEVVMPDGSISEFTLKDQYITEEIIQRWANNKFKKWHLETEREYEEIHYGVSIKRYSEGEVIKEAWARNVDDAIMWVKENIAHCIACHVSELGDYNIEYFGFFPRIYIEGFDDYYQFERGEFNEKGYIEEDEI